MNLRYKIYQSDMFLINEYKKQFYAIFLFKLPFINKCGIDFYQWNDLKAIGNYLSGIKIVQKWI